MKKPKEPYWSIILILGGYAVGTLLGHLFK